MAAPARTAVTYALGLLGGAGLFFLSFAAIFNGSWPLLLGFLLGYAGAGAVGVALGGAAPRPFALALAAPALPWVLWLFPGSVAEAGLLRALLWPGLVLVAGGLGWLGGVIATVATARRHRSPAA